MHPSLYVMTALGAGIHDLLENLSRGWQAQGLP
jgi:hypothetical protein